MKKIDIPAYPKYLSAEIRSVSWELSLSAGRHVAPPDSVVGDPV